MPLSRGPQRHLATRFDPRGTGLGFQIPLMDHLGRIRFLDEYVGFFKPSLHIAPGIDHMRGNIAGLVRFFLGGLFERVQIFVNQSGTRLHGPVARLPRQAGLRPARLLPRQ